MISTRKILSTSFPINVRRLSQLQPLRLAYASYENTPNPQAPPLIVHHGLFGSKANWNSLCKVYSKKTHRKIIALDARNHGDSPHSPEHTYEHLVTDLKNLIEQLNFGRVTLLGHSMGGRAVMLFALKHPDLVEKLIVVDISPMTTSPNLSSMPGLFKLMTTVNFPKGVPMSVARSNVDSQLAERLEDKDLRNFLLTNLVQKDGNYQWRINIQALLSNFNDIATFPEISSSQYTGPTLFIGGGDSDYLPREDHEGIRNLFPKAEFKYIEGVGHWVHSEKPAEFLEQTIDFLV